MADKRRLDVLLTQKGHCPSRERAQAMIMSGCVYVNGQKAEKAGQEFDISSEIEVRHDPIGFVSRGGLKLQKALDEFQIDVTGLSVLDCGASTGGFTDCLLQRGASHVWAIDVGYGQLAWTLRNDERVTCWERTNLRHVTLDQLGRRVDMAVMDLSFISLGLVLPVVKELLIENCQVICLVKPQFEAGKGMVGKNGVIREASTHKVVLESFVETALTCGYYVKQITFSPIKGPKGNIEFPALLVTSQCVCQTDISVMVDQAHSSLKGT